MKLYSENKEYKLYQGNMLDMLKVIEPNSIDSIVTDPPYELNFMGKGWDNSGIAFQSSTWLKCLEVLKPGGYLLAFGGSRTYHRIACAIEDAGFEIRDTIMWLYGSGFPKSMNIGLALDKRNGIESEVVGLNQDILIKQKKDLEVGHRKIVDSYNAGAVDRNNGFKNVSAEIKKPISEDGKKWSGWGTALKPSFEPIIIARKPFDGSCIDNVIKWGVGGINIDECRVGTDVIGGGTMPDLRDVGRKSKETIGIDKLSFGQVENAQRIEYEEHVGRFPANTILTYDDTDFDEVCGSMPETKGDARVSKPTYNKSIWGNAGSVESTALYNDSGSAARYFYNAKVSDKDEDVDSPIGRFPANTILTYDDTDYEEVCGGFPQSKGATSQNNYSNGHIYRGQSLNESNTSLNGYREWYNDDGSASRYFYCAKASKKDRDEGLAEFEEKKTGELQGGRKEGSAGSIMLNANGSTRVNPYAGSGTPKKNVHPTVKPCELMQYLVRLVTPNGGTVLDPFNGSGSTGKAVMYENREKLKGYKYIGIELTPEYLPISRARIEYASDPNNVIVREETDNETEEVTRVSYKEVNLF